MFLTAWSILCESAVFILFGFLLAGLLDAALTTARVIPLLSRRRARSVFWATIVGLPLPLCSCGVLPTALTLRRRGASKGATLSFLISTPETSVTSVLLTYALLGPVMAVFRPIAACVTALVAGLIENARGGEEETESSVPAADVPPAMVSLTVMGQPAPLEETCCATESKLAEAPAGESLRGRIDKGMRFAFVDLFDDIFAWVLVGIVVAAAIQVFLPPDVLQRIAGGPFQASLLMVLIGVPLYVCAEASTPIAAVLIAQGLNPGAALVFLLVGPATNIGSLGVLRKELGTRTIVIYLASIVVVSLLMGGVLNDTLANSSWDLSIRPLDEPLVPAWLKTAGALLFLIMGLGAARRHRYLSRLSSWLSARLPVRFTPRRLLGIAIVAPLAGYALSGIFVVRAGESGIVRRFGAVQRIGLEPGLHFAWPYPIDRVNTVRSLETRRMTLGVPREADSAAVDLTEGWQLVGDENIADVQVAVHWGAKPDAIIDFQFAVAQREALVRGVVLAAIREVVGGLPVDRVLTVGRGQVEEDIERLSRQRLEAYGSGIRIDAVRMLDAHAPPDVHAAFRDVASALEDRATYVDQARTMEARILPLARSQAVERREQTAAQADSLVRSARGEAHRFLALLEAYSRAPEVTRRRLELETLESVLPGVRKYIKPPADSGGEVEIWFVEKGELRRAQPFMED